METINELGKEYIPVKKLLQEESILPTVTRSLCHMIRVMTWNVWSADHYVQERITHIIRYIRTMEPDIICLQEVTCATYNMIKSVLDTNYTSFQVFMENDISCGTCLLCKKSTININSQPYYYDFEKTEHMCRVIGCEITHVPSNSCFHVLTTQLESGVNNDHIRADQFEIINKVVKPLKYAILAGDLNIVVPTEDTEDKINVSKFYDVWIDIGCPAKMRHTFSRKNINCNDRDSRSARPDRILYTSRNFFQIRAVHMIGCDCISESVQLPASTHYGLLADFTLDV